MNLERNWLCLDSKQTGTSLSKDTKKPTPPPKKEPAQTQLGQRPGAPTYGKDDRVKVYGQD